jgi:hypothetical protein
VDKPKRLEYLDFSETELEKKTQLTGEVMKKSDTVEVRSGAGKPARRMAWTERQTGERITTMSETFYHASDSPIRAFASDETICTFAEKNAGGAGYIYQITVPAGTVIGEYGNESRFEITTACAARYIGRRFYRYSKSWKPGQSPTLIDQTI